AATARCSTCRRRASSSATTPGWRWCMSGSDDLPRAWPSLVRIVRLGYRAEPKLLLAALGLTLLGALPDALLALWLKLLTDAAVDGDTTMLTIAAIGLAVSAAGAWFLR